MSFGNYLYFVLFLAAISALPGGLMSLPYAVLHYRKLKREGHPKTDIVTSMYAILVNMGMIFHALEEIEYKRSRILQMFHGVDTYAGDDGGLIRAAIFGILSLSLAVHYLNQTREWVPILYWVLQLHLAVACLAVF